MQCNLPARALVGAAVIGFAAVPLHAFMPMPGMAIAICGQPGHAITIPFDRQKRPARDDGMWGCHSCAPRKRAGADCPCGDDEPA
ncbi:hypothetical protein ACM61V_05510 [Sphingomonas sp. TX0543]|uniref:hypothetical protein n=1 Tax=unclassified Sphingomonas TaxID=196159 RepID=UPI0010F89DDB|nr:hypothetical protein [Sphingomonas sp. 3P27F8]